MCTCREIERRHVMRVIHFEDSLDKRMEISRVLQRIGIRNTVLALNVRDGMKKIEIALKAGNPFDIAITDMNYPINGGEASNGRAGERLIQILEEKNIDLPVIVCSSQNYRIPKAYGCVWYSDLSDWETDLIKLMEKRR